MSEQWKPVVGYEGRYEVSDHGRVWSLPRKQVQPNPKSSKAKFSQRIGGKFLKQSVSGGYCRVTLFKDGNRDRQLVHRLVLAAFLEEFSPNLDCNHKDGIRGNNRLSNLELVTRSENEQHKRDVLRKQIGETANSSKLTNEQVVTMKQEFAALMETPRPGGKKKPRIRPPKGVTAALAQKYGVSQTRVSQICRRGMWKEGPTYV